MRILIALLIGAAVSAQTTLQDAAGEIRLTYLGQAGYEITDGKTIVLVDPVITMVKLRRDTTPANLNVPKEISTILTPDTEAIDSKIKRADYILITHGHYDHLLDAPISRIRQARSSSATRQQPTLLVPMMCHTRSS